MRATTSLRTGPRRLSSSAWSLSKASWVSQMSLLAAGLGHGEGSCAGRGPVGAHATTGRFRQVSQSNKRGAAGPNPADGSGGRRWPAEVQPTSSTVVARRSVRTVEESVTAFADDGGTGTVSSPTSSGRRPTRAAGRRPSPPGPGVRRCSGRPRRAGRRCRSPHLRGDRGRPWNSTAQASQARATTASTTTPVTTQRATGPRGRAVPLGQIGRRETHPTILESTPCSVSCTSTPTPTTSRARARPAPPSTSPRASTCTSSPAPAASAARS